MTWSLLALFDDFLLSWWKVLVHWSDFM